MRTIIIQGILISYSFITVLLIPADTAFVVSFLTTVIYICAGDASFLMRWKGALPMLFLAACVFFPMLLIFTPAALYSMLDEERYAAGALLGALCAFFWLGREPGVFVMLLAGCVFACALLCESKWYDRLSEEFRKTRDDSAELNILLKEKNQSLLKNQDYEVYTATLRERNRIAREIHDNVGHMLSRAILMVGAMKAVDKNEDEKGPLGKLEETLHAAMDSVRESVHDLHDDSVNLKEALESLADGYAFCPVKLTYDMGYVVPREVKYSFIAIVKEALSNTAKHSDATRAEILAREHPGLYQLIIEDNGSVKEKGRNSGGMRAEDAQELYREMEGKGIGIPNMKSRASALGGTFQITKEQGFRIYITVPKKGEG